MKKKQLKKLNPDIRLERIRKFLQDHQRVDIVELAKSFGVSQITIRRDLEKLETIGHVHRTIGGAVPSERMAFEFDFAIRRQSCQREKRAIAQRAMQLIQPGHRLILDTGTTTLELAHLLKEAQEITVITPSLAVASVLQFSPGVQTVILGGIFRQGSADLTGAITEANLDMFAVDIAFQGTDALGEDGSMYNSDMRIAKVDQKIRRRAQRTYILSDSSKIGKTALVASGYLQQVDGLITDDKLKPQYHKAFKQLGANVIIANRTE
jgi:DeoR/GlpR family transcriptional regulator of sugar metabolism